MNTILMASAVMNILLVIWILRLISRVARLEQDAADLRTQLRLTHSKYSTYAKDILGMREAGL